MLGGKGVDDVKCLQFLHKGNISQSSDKQNDKLSLTHFDKWKWYSVYCDDVRALFFYRSYLLPAHRAIVNRSEAKRKRM